MSGSLGRSLFISLSLVSCRYSSADYSKCVCLFRMYHDQQSPKQGVAQGYVSFFNLGMLLVRDFNRQCIAENAGCLLEGDAMFAQIPAGLGLIPFELQSCGSKR
jgi:hypothetical protein